jgi:hypothetical protein
MQVTPRCLRKSESGKIIFDQKGISIWLVSLVFLGAGAAYAQQPVPIPAMKVNPESISDLAQDTAIADKSVQEIQVTKFNSADNAPSFDEAEAKLCEAELMRRGIKFKRLEKITDPKGCLAQRPLEVSTLSGNMVLSTKITTRCQVVIDFDNWVKNVVVPSAKLHLQKNLTEIKTSTSYHCRTRNNKKGAKVSEHGFANALDIIGFVFDDASGVSVSPKLIADQDFDLNQTKFQAAVRAGACAYFTTVLGPVTDEAHKDHFHFDHAVRRGGFRLCQ